MKDFYSTDEAGELLGVTRNTLGYYIRAGFLRAAKVGKCYIITAEDLRDFVERAKAEHYTRAKAIAVIHAKNRGENIAKL